MTTIRKNLKSSPLIAPLLLLIFSLVSCKTGVGDFGSVLSSVNVTQSASTAPTVSPTPISTPTPTPRPTVTPTPVATPTPTPNSSASLFWGINGHWAQGGASTSVSLAQQKITLQDLGVSLYRQDIYTLSNVQLIATNVAAIAPIKVEPSLIVDASGFSDETSAYNAGYSLGQGAAQVLKGLVPYYELSNERENQCILSGLDGNDPSHYDNNCFLKERGALRGLIAGIRSVDSATPLIGAVGGWLHFGFYDMLWKGTTPVSSTADTSKQVRWDVTSWHWYSDFGDITHACGGSGCYNVLNELKSRYGKPIIIDEFNERPGLSEQQLADDLTNTLLPMLWTNVAAYNIIGLSLYELYTTGAGDDYGVIAGDGVSKFPRYDAYKNFISNHPR